MSNPSGHDELHWIDGAYVFVGREPIPDGLRKSLLQRRRRARRRVAVLLICSLLPCCAGIALQEWMNPVNDWPLVLGISASALISVFFIVFAIDCERLSVLARRILRNGQLNRYEVAEPILYELRVRRSLGLEAPADPPRFVRTYAGTGHFADVGGEPTFRWQAPAVVRTAPVQAGASFGGGARPLEPAEASELRAAARRMFDFRQICTGVIGYGLLGLAIVPLARGFTPWWYLGLVLLVLLGIGAMTLGLAARFRLSRLMLVDLANGEVERLDAAEIQEAATGEDLVPERVERLGESKMMWTIDGLPALWRRLGG